MDLASHSIATFQEASHPPQVSIGSAEEAPRAIRSFGPDFRFTRSCWTVYGGTCLCQLGHKLWVSVAKLCELPHIVTRVEAAVGFPARHAYSKAELQGSGGMSKSSVQYSWMPDYMI